MNNHLFILRSQRPDFSRFLRFLGYDDENGHFHENLCKQMGYKIGILAQKIRQNKRFKKREKNLKNREYFWR